MNIENIEPIAEKVHKSWMKEKAKQGFHSPIKCESENHRSYQQSPIHGKEIFEDAELNERTYKWCNKCHPDMYPYYELPENIKEYDRVTVRSVLSAIKEYEDHEWRMKFLNNL